MIIIVKNNHFRGGGGTRAGSGAPYFQNVGRLISEYVDRKKK